MSQWQVAAIFRRAAELRSVPQERFGTVIDAGLIDRLTSTKEQVEASLTDFTVNE